MSESEESNISDECAEQTAPAEVVDLSQGFDSDGWDLYNVVWNRARHACIASNVHPNLQPYATIGIYFSTI